MRGEPVEKLREYIAGVVESLHAVDLTKVGAVLDVLESAYNEGRSVFVVGNGGSASNASHFAQDLSKGALPSLDDKRFRVLSLTDNIAFITAIANDIGYERVFDLQLLQFGQTRDVLVAISGSGNSPNILRAAECARELQMTVIAVTGFDGGALDALAEVNIHVPCDGMCQVEAVHSTIFHMIVDLLRERLSAE